MYEVVNSEKVLKNCQHLFKQSEYMKSGTPADPQPGASAPALLVSEPSTLAFDVVLVRQCGGQRSREAQGRCWAGSSGGYSGCICPLYRL